MRFCRDARQRLERPEIVRDLLYETQPPRNYRSVRFCPTDADLWTEFEISDCGNERLSERQQLMRSTTFSSLRANRIVQHKRLVKRQRTD